LSSDRKDFHPKDDLKRGEEIREKSSEVQAVARELREREMVWNGPKTGDPPGALGKGNQASLRKKKGEKNPTGRGTSFWGKLRGGSSQKTKARARDTERAGGVKRASGNRALVGVVPNFSVNRGARNSGPMRPGLKKTQKRPLAEAAATLGHREIGVQKGSHNRCRAGLSGDLAWGD